MSEDEGVWRDRRRRRDFGKVHDCGRTDNEYKTERREVSGKGCQTAKSQRRDRSLSACVHCAVAQKGRDDRVDALERDSLWTYFARSRKAYITRGTRRQLASEHMDARSQDAVKAVGSPGQGLDPPRGLLVVLAPWQWGVTTVGDLKLTERMIADGNGGTQIWGIAATRAVFQW